LPFPLIIEIVTQKILIVKQNLSYVDVVCRKKCKNIKEDMMDIFSTTSKQVETAVTPKVQQQTPVRQVEQSNEATKSLRDNKQDSQNVAEQLNYTVKELNKQMESLDTNVTFGFNDKIDTMFVSVMERSTGKMIRKIPTEEAMSLAEKMKEIVGMIFDKKG
jgi:flagellar protein FlaG